MTARHATTDDLRAAVAAALPGLKEDQAMAARALLNALSPSLAEPTWPGAPVMAACPGFTKPRLHVRRNGGREYSEWECDRDCVATPWNLLVNPRPLTPAEYAEHGIPQPCDHVADEETVKRATRAFYADVAVTRHTAMRAALIAAGFKAAE